MKNHVASKSRSQGRRFYSIIFSHPVIKNKTGTRGLRIRRGLNTPDSKKADNLVNQMNELLKNKELWNIDAKSAAEKLYDPIIISAFYDALELQKEVPFIIAYESGLGKGWKIIDAIDRRGALNKFKEIEPHIYKLCKHYGKIYVSKVEMKIEKKKSKKEDMMKILDANGKEIQVGNRVRFATWGMFDILPIDEERKETDPKYVTHVNYGTVEELLDEVSGTLHIRPDGVNGVIHICTKPGWNARPEFIEIVD